MEEKPTTQTGQGAIVNEAECRELLDLTVEKKASDLHLTVDMPPIIRIDGKLYPQTDRQALTASHAEKLIKSFMNEDQFNKFVERKEIDFSFPYKEKVR